MCVSPTISILSFVRSRQPKIPSAFFPCEIFEIYGRKPGAKYSRTYKEEAKRAGDKLQLSGNCWVKNSNMKEKKNNPKKEIKSCVELHHKKNLKMAVLFLSS